MDLDELKPVVSTIKATQARIHFGEVLKRTHSGKEHLVVEKDGIPLAVIISKVDYDKYRRLLAQAQLEKLSRAVNREAVAGGITEEKLDQLVEEAKTETFEERYGRKSA